MDDLEKELEKLRKRQAKYLEWFEKLNERMLRLEAKNIALEANLAALLKCVEIFGKLDPKLLSSKFETYQKEIHQKLLEKIEDIDPEMAAKLDRRNPAKE